MDDRQSFSPPPVGRGTAGKPDGRGTAGRPEIRSLREYGWDSYFESHFRSEDDHDGEPARVTAEHKGSYRIITESGETTAANKGRLQHHAEGRLDLPAVGDWVVCRRESQDGPATITRILPRKSQFVRKVAGRRTAEQIVAANIETVFILSSMNRDFSPRRLERYLVAAWESGSRPVILLTKSDLVQSSHAIEVEAIQSAQGVPVHAVSSLQGTGFEALAQYLVPGEAIALLGSSGVGKSTLVNYLAGEEKMAVREIRDADARGRHKTTHRQLIKLPSGGLLIDTPGMRELQFWEGSDGIKETFEDIAVLSRSCRFDDCIHETEPGCAVQAAIDEGTLDAERLASHRKLLKELAFQERRRDAGAALAEKRRWKKLNKSYREIVRVKRKGF